MLKKKHKIKRKVVGLLDFRYLLIQKG